MHGDPIQYAIIGCLSCEPKPSFRGGCVYRGGDKPKFKKEAYEEAAIKWNNRANTRPQPSICKDGLPKLTQENPYVTQPKADVEGLKKDTSNTQELLAKCEDFTVGYNNGWNAAIDSIAAQGYIGEWRPIECAPKDGEYFLVCLPRMMNLIMRARFDTVHKQWLSERDNDGAISRVEFFHAGDFWMPMPKPPAAQKKEGE